MYKIIGVDRKEYGPESVEQIRQWIIEGRANGQTLGRAEGSTEWKPLLAFPEFADAVSAARVPPPLTGAFASSGTTGAVEELLAREPDFSIGDCFNRAVQLLRDNFGLLIGATVLVGFLDFVVRFIPFAHAFLSGVLFGGLYLVYLKRIRGQETSVGEAFSGFSTSFAQLLLAGFLSTFLASLGYFFCVLPGVFLHIVWIFCVPLVADKRLEFWSAMELSRKVVTRVWFKVFGLVILSFAPFIVVTLFISVKVMMMMFTMMGEGMATSGGAPNFSKLMEIVTATTSLQMIAQLILLVNLPFAVAALMYAYEDLFGPRVTPTA